MKETCRPELLTDGGKLKFYVPLMSSPPQQPEDLYQTTAAAAAGGEGECARELASPAALKGIPASRSSCPGCSSSPAGQMFTEKEANIWIGRRESEGRGCRERRGRNSRRPPARPLAGTRCGQSASGTPAADREIDQWERGWWRQGRRGGRMEEACVSDAVTRKERAF